MSPPPSEHGIYTDLGTKSFKIRLLQFEGGRSFDVDTEAMLFRMSIFELNHAPKYRCLSYVWGREEFHPIQVRTDPVQIEFKPVYRTMYITKNCLGFLRRMRCNPKNPNYPDGYLWVDAICINQHDDAEKAIQIREMARIYAQAGQVIAWLGWEWDRYGNAEDSGQNDHLQTEAPAEHAVDAVREIASAFRGYKQRGGDPWNEGFGGFAFDQQEMHRLLELRHFPIKTWAAISLFLCRVYYSRSWIVQEAVLAHSLVLVCGWQVMPWNDILEASIFLQASGWYQRLAQLLPSTTSEHPQLPPGWPQLVFASLRMRVHHNSAPAGGLGPYDQFHFDQLNLFEVLSAVVRVFRHFDATVPKDKIFSPLAILQEMLRKRILPFEEDDLPRFSYDMESPEVFRQITVVLLEGCGHLNLLSEVQDSSLNLSSTLSTKELQSLPSWVPDYSQYAVAMFSGIPGLHFDAVPGRSKRCEVDKSQMTLTVEGCLLGKVEQLAPTFGNTLWIKDFRELVKFCITMEPLHMSGQDRMEAVWRTLIADCDGKQTPANVNMGSAFKNYVQITAAILLYGDGSKETIHKAEEANSDWSSWKCFDDLHYSSPEAASIVPDIEELASFAERWRQAMLGGQVALPTAHRLSRPSAAYSNAVGRACIHRRMFITEQGYLCMGPQSIEVGDQVWFLSGASVPFILRSVSEDEGGGFRVVAETYVHGYMHGKIVEDTRDEDWVEVLIQ